MKATVGLTLHNDVLTLPKVVWAAEHAGIDERGVLPSYPLCPITTEIPRVAEEICTVGLMGKRVLAI
jgi:hypothetical protein